MSGKLNKSIYSAEKNTFFTGKTELDKSFHHTYAPITRSQVKKIRKMGIVIPQNLASSLHAIGITDGKVDFLSVLSTDAQIVNALLAHFQNLVKACFPNITDARDICANTHASLVELVFLGIHGQEKLPSWDNIPTVTTIQHSPCHRSRSDTLVSITRPPKDPNTSL